MKSVSRDKLSMLPKQNAYNNPYHPLPEHYPDKVSSALGESAYRVFRHQVLDGILIHAQSINKVLRVPPHPELE